MSEQISVSGTRQWQAGQWLGFGAMDSVSGINAQCLDLLCSTAGSAQPLPGLLAGHQARWCALSPTARSQLAASPYLLADAGFDDERRWLWPGRRMVRDLRRDFAAPYFIGEHVGDFVRGVLVFGWHLARANPQLARVALGMPPSCAERIGRLRLQDLDWLAQHRPGWVRPRWERQPRIWQHLLLAAREPDGHLLTQVSLRGLQLMASGVLATGVRPRGL